MKSTSRIRRGSLGIKFAALIVSLAFTGSAYAQEKIQPETELQLPAQQVEQIDKDKLDKEEVEQDDKAGAVTPSSIEENKAISPSDLQGADKLPAIQKDKLPAVQNKQPVSGEPEIVRVTPAPATPGSQVRIEGRHFGPVRSGLLVLIIEGRGHHMGIRRWSDSEITATLPPEVDPGSGEIRLVSSDRSTVLSTIDFEIISPIADTDALPDDAGRPSLPDADEKGGFVPSEGGEGSDAGFVPRKPETDLGDRTPDAMNEPKEILEKQHPEEVTTVHKPAQEAELVTKDNYVLEPAQTRTERVGKNKNFDAAIGARCWPERRYADGEIQDIGDQEEPLWESGMLVVGYDYYNYWEPRKRCELGTSLTYKSMVKFDMSDLPDDREIESAELSFHLVDENRIGDGHRKTVAQRINHTNFCGGPTGDHRTAVGEAVAAIGFPQAEWSPGHEVVTAHTPTNIVIGLTPGGAHSVNITPFVKSWLEGSTNRGLAFLGKRYDYPQTNKVCVAGIGNIRLEIQYPESD